MNYTVAHKDYKVFFINNLSKILFFMTRILRLLLIAAVALPYFGNAAAQEVKPERTSFPKKVDVQEINSIKGR